jgi:cell division protein FtsB
MATRRPKVPRAAAAVPKPTATGQGEAAGGDVIRADFGATRQGSAPEAPTRRAGQPGQPGTPTPGHRPATGGAGKGAPASSPGSAGTGPAASAARGAGKGAGANGERAGVPEAEATPVPAKAFSGRMLALALVMVAITIMLAPSVKIFIDKRAEIADLQADIAAKQAKQTDLKRQVSRWQDPNYVKQQARDRINMVMPGETGYWVFGGDLPAGSTGSGDAAGTVADPANLPWVDSLWESITRSATD